VFLAQKKPDENTMRAQHPACPDDHTDRRGLAQFIFPNVDPTVAVGIALISDTAPQTTLSVGSSRPPPQQRRATGYTKQISVGSPS
jgi:hypothetical protein